MTPEELASIDQAMASLVDLIPRGAWSMYEAFTEAGFDKGQALELTKQWIHTTLGGRGR